MDKKEEEEFLKTEDNVTWKACIFCGGEIVQVRKAFFTCLNCNQEFIADAEDMKGETPSKKFIIK